MVISMRRADLLAVTGVSVGLFNNLAQRRLMPFHQPASGGWGRFTADHAFRLALFLELGRAGRSQEQAAALVRTEYDDLLFFASRSGSGGEVLFGSFAIFEQAESEASQLHLPIVCLLGGGELDRVVEKSLETVERDRRQVCEIAVINASLVLRRLLERARATGLNDASFEALVCRFQSPPEALVLASGAED
ncbi:hypothetical protein D3C71_1116190 [compost metagenome]